MTTTRLSERAGLRTWIIALIGVLLAALMLTGTPSIPAHAAGTGSISGKVTLPAGTTPAVFSGMYVYATSASGPSTASAKPNAAGQYQLTGLDAGDYTVTFSVGSYWDDVSQQYLQPNVLSEYYNNSATFQGATKVVVGTGPRTGINATLEPGATISGTVTFPGSIPSKWREQVNVTAMSTDGAMYGYSSASVKSTGSYSIPGLPAGNYVLQFTPIAYWEGSELVKPNLTTNYAPGTGRSGAATVTVSTGGSQGGVNSTMSLGSTINLRVTPPPGTNTASVSVIPTSPEHPASGWSESPVLSAAGLTPGHTYYVSLNTSSAAGSASQYLARTSDSYVFTAPAAGTTDSYNLTALPTTASISGTATASGFVGYQANDYLADIAVYQKLGTNWVERWVGSANSVTKNGALAYSIPGLAAGTYTVGFEAAHTPNSATVGGIAEQWWQNKSSLAAADSISLTTGQNRTGINGTITPLTVAGAPTGVTAVAGNAQATVSWTAPVNTGGSPITGYTVTAAPGGKTATVAGTALTAAVTGLTNGTTYTFTVKATNAKGTSAASVASAAVTPTAPPVAGPFTDIASSAFKAEIEWMFTQGITTGYNIGNGQREYRPYGNVTRDAMAAFLYRDAEVTDFTPPTVSPFTDVATNHPFYKEITWLAASGISGGWDMGNGKKEYRPGLNITRDAMAVFLYRYAEITTYTPPATSPFVDVPTSNGFYKEIAWMASTGITTGYDLPGGKKEFRPFNPITRDAMAAFLFRFDALP